MKCGHCFITDPEPFECYNEKGETISGFWFVIERESPVELVGVEPNGEIAFRYLFTK